ADALDGAGLSLAPLAPQTIERINASLPDFGSVNNPLVGTGSFYDNPELLPARLDAVLANPGNAAIACAISAGTSTEQMLRLADTCADAAKTSGRTVLAYQASPLGASLKPEL